MIKRMNKYFVKYIAFSIILSGLVSGCNTLKHLPDNEKLYVRADISFEGKIPGNYKKEILSEIADVTIPEPNNKILGIRLGLWAYQKVKRDKAGFYAKWINKRLGEEPALMSDVSTKTVEKLMYNRLENLGYFNSIINSDTTHSKKTGKATYEIEAGNRIYIADYKYKVTGDSAIDTLVTAYIAEETRIKKGTTYTLAKLTNEREKISELLKTYGYYYFEEKYFHFTADSLVTEKMNEANLLLEIKQSTPQEALLRYKVSDITVYPKYSIKSDSAREARDSTNYEGVDFIQEEEFFLPRRMYPYILIKEGDFYNNENEEFTNRRLSSLQTYRFVNIRHEDDSISSNGYGQLNTSIFLSPMNKRAIRADLQAVSKSNNFIGPTLNLEYTNRNLFKGGESLTVGTKVGYEAQLSRGEVSGLSSFETGLQGELTIPRLVAPFQLETKFRYSIPKTKIKLSYSLLERVKLFTLHSALAQFGYEWTANAFVKHSLNPISINWVDLKNTTVQFNKVLENNPILRRSFEQQFIAGLNYSFQYSKLNRPDQKSRFYILFNADLAGNTLSLAQNIIGRTGEDQRLFGQRYAQYSKFDIDVRHYLNTSEEGRLVARVFAGFGIPYGNSNSLPYAKQFFAGGPNSIRAFRIRSVGPGGYVPEEQESAGAFFDQAGDIKLEANLEYRFPIVSVLKGAIFTDAGNIWIKNDDGRDGKFEKGWEDQIVVGAGVGLRVDLDFFVIRLDVATPLRLPIRLPNDTVDFIWQDDFQFGSKTWRQQNIVWNFGIGYPF
jgi:outer membrane protein assembly factor BamA